VRLRGGDGGLCGTVAAAFFAPPGIPRIPRPGAAACGRRRPRPLFPGAELSAAGVSIPHLWEYAIDPKRVHLLLLSRAGKHWTLCFYCPACQRFNAHEATPHVGRLRCIHCDAVADGSDAQVEILLDGHRGG
jgi:hypothetical protein